MPPSRPRLPRGAVIVAVVVLALVSAGAGYLAGRAQDGAVSSSGSVPAPPVTLKPQPVDVGFAQDMADHHDQAVQMALLAIDRATSQPVRTLAVAIATDQRREMGILDQFLRDRGVAPADKQRTVMDWMHEPVPHDQMPGLATSAQMVALTNAEGADFDRMFVDLMIRHHQGGIHMAEYAVAHAETQYIRDFASRMIVAQNNEINDLQQLAGAG